jgi:hypothetical protein
MPSAARTDRPWGSLDEVVRIPVGDRTVVALTPSDGRVRVGLVMPVVGRVVDISVQPSAASTALVEAARSSGVAWTTVERTARAGLDAAAERAGAWTPSEEVCLTRAFGGVAFPLLAAAFDVGAEPVAEVPRWAAAVLSAPTVGRGAVVAFGAAATRPVRRALVEAIRPLPCGTVDLTSLGLGLMGLDVLQPDRLARVLSAERVLHPPADLPDPATLGLARRVLRDWGDVRAERVLVEAAARSDGLRVLLETVRWAHSLGDHGPSGRLPARLGELHDAHRSLLRSDDAPPPPPPPAPRRAVPAPTPARRPTAPPPPHRMLAPPTTMGMVRHTTALPLTPAERALDGTTEGSIMLVLPRTAGDLARWGRLLSNCLGDFGPAVAAGRSTIVGVHRANRLVAAVELTPSGTIRQFCGAANRPPADRDRRVVVGMLRRAGLLDTSAAANRPWLAGVEGAA